MLPRPRYATSEREISQRDLLPKPRNSNPPIRHRVDAPPTAPPSGPSSLATHRQQIGFAPKLMGGLLIHTDTGPENALPASR